MQSLTFNPRLLTDLFSEINAAGQTSRIVELGSRALRTLFDPRLIGIYLADDAGDFVRQDAGQDARLPVSFRLETSPGSAPRTDAELRWWETRVRQAADSRQRIHIAMPLISRGDLHGCILVGEKSDQAPCEDEDRALLHLLGNHMALALDRPRWIREFSSELAHEAKTPLANIALPAELCYRDFAEMERRRCLLPDLLPQLKRRLRYIQTQSLEGSRRLDGLRQLKDPGHPARRAVLLAEVVRNSLGSLEPQIRRTAVSVDNGIPEDLPGIEGDARQLEIVFCNLIKNSLEAMGLWPTRRLRLEGRASAGRVEIAVRDSGPGILPEHRTKIFDAHFSTKTGDGRGMGLSLVRQIVRAHHGEISFMAGLRSGSCFAVALPYRAR